MKLEALQREFTAHIRNPEHQPTPGGVEDRRMKIYRDLFFNNIESLLSANFPVLRQVYDDTAWNCLVRDFYADHHCQTPLFPEVAREFLRYLQDERSTRDSDPPFLLELAHYEWIELALDLDGRNVTDLTVDRQGDLLEGVPVLSALVHVLSYRFPVHRISPDFQPDETPEQPTHLLVYRDRNDEVRFMLLNAVSRLLATHLQDDTGETGRQLLLKVAEEIGHPDPAKVVSAGTRLLADLRDRDILLGTRRP
jgi:hypothetical protein